MRPPLVDPSTRFTLDDGDTGQGSSAPGPDSSTPRWRRLLPLSALLLAGAVYVSILSINWTPLFKPLAQTDFIAGVVRSGVFDPLHPGDSVGLGEKLRFQVQTSEPTRVAVLALGSDKHATLLLPAEGSTLLVPAGGGYQASSDSRLLLAVDDEKTLEELRVVWSTGREEVWQPLNPGSEIVLIEHSSP